ncbi:MAG: hypothetical protein ACOCWM_03415 [Cyclobacteriaceae bacterium]
MVRNKLGLLDGGAVNGRNVQHHIWGGGLSKMHITFLDFDKAEKRTKDHII